MSDQQGKPTTVARYAVDKVRISRGRDYEFGLSFGLVYSTCSGMGLPGPDFDFVHTRALSIVFSIEDSEVLERWQRLKEKNEQDFIQGLSDAKRLVRVRAE